jgi:hypothetical protein
VSTVVIWVTVINRYALQRALIFVILLQILCSLVFVKDPFPDLCIPHFVQKVTENINSSLNNMSAQKICSGLYVDWKNPRIQCKIPHTVVVLRESEKRFLGAFAELRKATVSFVTSFCPSICLSAWNNTAPSGRIFMKFYIWAFVENLSRKFNFH